MSPLPAPLTRFVGRESELAEAAALLAEVRLLTLTGPGGAGKTRLALHVAATLSGQFPDGVWFVDLSALPGGEFVLDKVAITLGVKEPRAGRTLAEAVGRYLARRQALLVLDNCEHVVESAAKVLADLLAAAPALKVVATSREPLGVGGEVTWAVPPLIDADAVELFSDRARQARPQFQLGPEDADAARAICRRLDSLPLAIELAAARTRALAPGDIAARLKDRFELLPPGPRTAPARQATLSASFDWSYELLSGRERVLLRQCSVFAGGFDLEAASAVCSPGGADVLAALVDRSMLVVQDFSQGSRRYRMLETIREFATQRLAEAGEVDLIHTRHRDHYLALVEAAEPELLGPDEDRWRACLTAEQDNLRAALAWSRDHGDAEAMARMVAALVWFWAVPAPRLADLRSWLDAAADRVGDLSPRVAARIRNFQAYAGMFTGRSVGDIPALANDALALARAAGDRREEAFALLLLGLMAGLLGGAEAMRPYLEEGLPLARATGFAFGAGLALTSFVALRWFQSDPEETRRLAEEAIAIAKTADRHHRLDTLAWAGMTAVLQGRLADAAQLWDGVVAEGRQTDDFNYLFAPIFLGWLGMLRGEFAAARAAIAESLAAAERWEADGKWAPGVELLAMFVQGMMQLAVGNPAQASQMLPVVVESARSSPLAARWAAVPLVFLAEAQLALDEREEAAAFLDEATSLARAGAFTWVLGRAARVRAELRTREGDLHEAESLAHEALSLGREAGDQVGFVDALELLARLVAGQKSPKEAARLWAAADSLRSELRYARFPVDQGPYQGAVANAKEALGADEFAAAWAEGAKLSADEAIAYAARGRGERKRPSTGWASLTPSELEVVRLVGEHLTNPEIAARLFISRATVKTHLVHIFSKLDIDSRSELLAEVLNRRTRTPTSQHN
jgi:predicted ATPase/DNA-binding CsgD family transcriptional regulator